MRQQNYLQGIVRFSLLSGRFLLGTRLTMCGQCSGSGLAVSLRTIFQLWRNMFLAQALHHLRLCHSYCTLSVLYTVETVPSVKLKPRARFRRATQTTAPCQLLGKLRARMGIPASQLAFEILSDSSAYTLRTHMG